MSLPSRNFWIKINQCKTNLTVTDRKKPAGSKQKIKKSRNLSGLLKYYRLRVNAEQKVKMETDHLTMQVSIRCDRKGKLNQKFGFCVGLLICFLSLVLMLKWSKKGSTKIVLISQFSVLYFWKSLRRSSDTHVFY